MQIGELYLCTLYNDRWLNKILLYLGEAPLLRSDGVTILNHKVHVGGREVLVDATMLKYFKKLEED